MKIRKTFLYNILIFLLLILLTLNSDNKLCFAEEDSSASSFIEENVVSSDNTLQVFSLSLKSNGDCILLKNGNTEILMDLGGKGDITRKKISSALETIVSDKVLDYVIITHPDEDHVENMNLLNKWVVENKGKVSNLIDFDVYPDMSVSKENFAPKEKEINQEENMYDKKPVKTYYNYKKLRDVLTKSLCPTINYVTASQCCYEKRKESEVISER